MTRASLKTWAVAGALVLLAGCSPIEYFSGLFATAPGADGDRVVVGSLKVVADDTQGHLQQLGLAVERTERAGAIYLTSKTRAGGSFTVVLTSEQSPQGERTRVRLDWKDGRDDQFGLQVLTHVEKQSAH
jgi:hypothetical protein